MAVSIGHEINNPLSVIQLSLDELEEEISEPEINRKRIQEEVVQTKKTIARIRKIINGIKIVGRDPKNDPILPVNLKALIEETFEFCNQRYKSAAIQLNFNNIPKDAVIHCLAVEISQVLLNLLNNAHDAIYKLEKRWVRLEVTETADRVSASSIT